MGFGRRNIIFKALYVLALAPWQAKSPCAKALSFAIVPLIVGHH